MWPINPRFCIVFALLLFGLYKYLFVSCLLYFKFVMNVNVTENLSEPIKYITFVLWMSSFAFPSFNLDQGYLNTSRLCIPFLCHTFLCNQFTTDNHYGHRIKISKLLIELLLTLTFHTLWNCILEIRSIFLSYIQNPDLCIYIPETIFMHMLWKSWYMYLYTHPYVYYTWRNKPKTTKEHSRHLTG